MSLVVPVVVVHSFLQTPSMIEPVWTGCLCLARAAFPASAASSAEILHVQHAMVVKAYSLGSEAWRKHELSKAYASMHSFMKRQWTSPTNRCARHAVLPAEQAYEDAYIIKHACSPEHTGQQRCRGAAG
eukprot:1155885-Pelagomonas_calceolata.AAC.3